MDLSNLKQNDANEKLNESAVESTVETSDGEIQNAGANASAIAIDAPAKKENFLTKILKPIKGFFADKTNLALYGIMLPAFIYVIIFHYLPMFGLVIAFKDYSAFRGIGGSPWAGYGGMKHFFNFVTLPDFWILIKNTLLLSTISLAIGTVLPIIFALLVNEIRGKNYKRLVQTVSYAPYFISTVVVVSMMFIFGNMGDVAPDGEALSGQGAFNKIIGWFGAKPIAFMEKSNLFIAEYVISGVWQALGWSAIIYVGTLANVDMSQHEAAVIDGASRLQRIIHINLPTIIPIMTIQLIMNVGNILNIGFEKVYLMQTDGNLSASRIISTYVYEVSLDANRPQFSYATAIGMFNSFVSIILLIATNVVCKKVSETSLW